jgi:hypothetical protein
MLNLIKAITLSLLLFTTDFATASVRIASNEDSHPFRLESLPGLPATSKSGIFKNTADVTKDAPMVSFIGSSIVKFTQNGTYWDFTMGFGTDATRLGDVNFQRGFHSSTGWISETESSQIAAFIDSSIVIQNNAKLFAHDVKPSQPSSYSTIELVPVPLPVAAWSMLSALVGLLYIGRRKNKI